MTVESFLKLLSDDSSFLEQVNAAQTMPDLIAIAGQRGIVLTPEEVIKMASSSVNELSDAQLEAIAGGAWTSNIGSDYALGATVGAVAGAGIGAALATSVGAVVK